MTGDTACSPRAFGRRSGVARYPMSRPHPIQGIGADFIPKLTEDAVDQHLIVRIVPVNGDPYSFLPTWLHPRA